MCVNRKVPCNLHPKASGKHNMLFRNLLPANLGHKNRHENPHISNSQSSEWINKWNVPSTRGPQILPIKESTKSQKPVIPISFTTQKLDSILYFPNKITHLISKILPFFATKTHSSKRFWSQKNPWPPTGSTPWCPNPAHFSWSKSSARVSKPAAPEAPSKPFVAAAPGMGKTWKKTWGFTIVVMCIYIYSYVYIYMYIYIQYIYIYSIWLWFIIVLYDGDDDPKSPNINQITEQCHLKCPKKNQLKPPSSSTSEKKQRSSVDVRQLLVEVGLQVAELRGDLGFEVLQTRRHFPRRDKKRVGGRQAQKPFSQTM